MKSISTKRLALGLLALLIVHGSLSLEAQSSAQPTTPIRIEKGTKLALDLESPLNSATTREGDTVLFRARNDIKVAERIAIPRGALIRGTVKLVRPGFVNGKKRHAEIQIRFEEIPLVNGSRLALKTADLKVKAEAGSPGFSGVVQGAQGQGVWTGALLGGLIGRGRASAGIGAVAGIGVGILTTIKQPRALGSEVDLPRGAIFETRLERALEVSDAALLAKAPDPAPPILPFVTPSVAAPGVGPIALGRPDLQPPVIQPPAIQPPTIPAGNGRWIDRVPAAPAPAASRATPTEEQPVSAPVETAGDFTLSVDVNLVLIDAVVHDRADRPMTNLQKEDFRLFEDGVEQLIQALSRDEYPLAVALLIDRSGSVAPLMSNIQRAAFQALQQLKRGDAVCLISFAGETELLEGLTTDRDRVANRIGDIRAGGGTSIVDAVDDALRYLARTAPDRRRAVILISDNIEGRSRATTDQAVQRALESDAVVYSVKITQGSNASLPFGLPVPMIPAPRVPTSPGGDPVPAIAKETGGEVFDVKATALDAALATAIARLKLRYTLSYDPHHSSTGNYHRVDVRLVDRFGKPGADYTVHARSGYYDAGNKLGTVSN